jgi:hypothetical protein
MASNSRSASKPTSKKKTWRAVVGATLPDGSRVEAGELWPVTPPKWIIDQGKAVKD